MKWVFCLIPVLYFFVLQEYWTLEEVDAVKHAIAQFSYFLILPTKYETQHLNDDAFYMRAKIYGIEEDDLIKEVVDGKMKAGWSIVYMFYSNLSAFITDLEEDFFKQLEYPYLDYLKNTQVTKYASFNNISSQKNTKNDKTDLS